MEGLGVKKIENHWSRDNKTVFTRLGELGLTFLKLILNLESQYCTDVFFFFSPQIGLDFTPWFANTNQERDEQINVFIKQLEISKEMDLPV